MARTVDSFMRIRTPTKHRITAEAERLLIQKADLVEAQVRLWSLVSEEQRRRALAAVARERAA